jgi:hypothetical protein
MGELAPSVEAELKTHVKGCGRCRHELDWLKTEHGLFRMRAGRDEVASLWKGVAERSGIERPRRWPSAVATFAVGAALLLPLGLWALAGSSPTIESLPATVASTPVEPGPMTVAGGASVDLGNQACSTLPEGLGFHCGPVTQASFFASR